MRMTSIILMVGMVIAIPSIAYAQPDTLWTRSDINAGSPLQVIRTTDGGFAIGTGGFSRRYERLGTEFKIVKLDTMGQVEWVRYLVDRDIDDPDLPVGGQGWMIAQVYDGGFMIGGWLGNRFGLARLSADGDSLWLRSYPSDEFDYISRSGECCLAPDSNIVVTSQNNVAKFSVENGDIIWRCILEDQNVNNIEPAGDDGFLVTGFTGFFDNAYAARIDADGELIWEREYEAEAAEVCTGLTSVTAGGWCLTVNHRFGEGGNDIYAKLMRIDEDGEIIWQRVYDGLGRDKRITDILETSDGGFVAAGGSNSCFYTLRTDYAGEVLWQAEYGGWFGGDPNRGDIYGYAYSLLPMEHGGYVLGGFGNYGCWLVCTEADPVDIPFELEAGEEEHAYEEVTIDSVGVWEFELRNTGRRYAVIDSLWFEGDSVFACPLELPFRIEPEDTSLVPVLFQPLADTTYTATLILRYGDEQTLEITLSGRGLPLSAPEEPNVLREFVLHEAYPNPFNSSVTITYEIVQSASVKLAVYDVRGRLVEELENRRIIKGHHRLTWTHNISGIYFILLETCDDRVVKKIVCVP